MHILTPGQVPELLRSKNKSRLHSPTQAHVCTAFSVAQRLGQAAGLQSHPTPALVAMTTRHLMAHGIKLVVPAIACFDQALAGDVVAQAQVDRVNLFVERGEKHLAEQHEDALRNAQAEHHLQQRVSEA